MVSRKGNSNAQKHSGRSARAMKATRYLRAVERLSLARG